MKKPQKKSPRKKRRSADKKALARPNVATKDAVELKSFLLLWLGTLSAALTIFGGLQTVLDLADWSKYLTENWNRIITATWNRIFITLGGSPNNYAAAPMTFFASLMAISISGIARDQNEKQAPSSFFSPATIMWLFPHLCVAVIAMIVFWMLVELISFGTNPFEAAALIPTSRWLSIPPIIFGFVYFASHDPFHKTIHRIILATSVGIFYYIISIKAAQEAASAGEITINEFRKSVLETSVILFPLQLMSILSWSTARYLNFRLFFIFLLVVTIYTLNEISLSKISLRPPAA